METNKKGMKSDPEDFKAVRKATDELGEMMCKYIASQQLSVRLDIAAMAGATLNVLKSFSGVTGGSLEEITEVYISALRRGVPTSAS